MIGSFQELRERVRELPPVRAAVAGAHGEVAVKALRIVRELNGTQGILVGNAVEIGHRTQGETWEILHETEPEAAARAAVKCVRQGSADLIVKGACSTAEFMKACLDPALGLRGAGLMAQLFCFSTARSAGLKFLSDAALTIRPSSEERASMIHNAVPLIRALGRERPRVALLAALEKASPKLPDTIESTEIAAQTERWDRLGCDVEGPLSIDCALSAEAARVKGLTGPVAGAAELLIFPDLASANIFSKGICLLGGAESGALVLGGTAPIVLRSRADTVEEKVNSILLGIVASALL